MLEQKESRIRFTNQRNSYNYLSWQQAAIAVEESMINDKTNYQPQKSQPTNISSQDVPL